MLIAEGRLPPSQAEVRFSARRAAQVTNYNDDEADEFEESEDDMTPNHWAVAEEDTGPIIDKILDHRPKEGTGKPTGDSLIHSLICISELDPFHAEKKDFEYLVSAFHTTTQCTTHMSDSRQTGQMAGQSPLPLDVGGLRDCGLAQGLAEAGQLLQGSCLYRHACPQPQEVRARGVRAAHGRSRIRA